MKRNLILWQATGFVFTLVFGVILHFLFSWSGNNIIVACISSVNESIWEHMKLIFFPTAIFAFIESKFISYKYQSFWCVKLTGIVLGIILIPVLYYTLNGAFGPLRDIFNIVIFIGVSFIVYYLETLLFKSGILICQRGDKPIIILLCIALMFVVLTFVPPSFPLFKDPVSGACGYRWI